MHYWDSKLKIKNECISLRIIERKEHFFTPPDLIEPKKGVIFELSTADIESGEKQNMQPLLSIWDGRVPHCMLKYKRNLQNKKTTTFELKAESLHSLKLITPHNIEVCIVKDPLNELFGNCHYGIQGLYFDKKKDKLLKSKFLEIREKILELSRKVEKPTQAKTMLNLINLIMTRFDE